MDHSVEIHPKLAKLFPASNTDLLDSEEKRLPLTSTPAPTAPTSAPSSPPSFSRLNGGYGTIGNNSLNLPNLRGPMLFPNLLPGSMRPRMPSTMDHLVSASNQQQTMFAKWTPPLAAGLSGQMLNMLFARNLAIAAANSSQYLFAQSSSASSINGVNGGLTMQQLASAMGPLLSSSLVTKADALVCGTSSSHRGNFEPPFYSQVPATHRSDDFVRHIDETATATARSMLMDDRRCTASESVASARKLTTGGGRPTPSSHTSPLSDNKNWKRRPVPAVVPKCDRIARSALEHSPGPSGDSVVVTREASRAPSKVVSAQPTDASGGGMLVSRRTVDGHLDVRVVYLREFVLQCSGSPYTSLPPPNLSTVVLEMNEIVAKFPGRFQPARYAKWRDSLVDHPHLRRHV